MHDKDMFFDHVKVANVFPKEPFQESYVFNLSVGAFLINGIRYNRKTGAIHFPKNVKGRHAVTVFGTTVYVLQRLFDDHILALEAGDVEGGTEAPSFAAAA
jgi:hypothetical protein